MRDHDVTGTTAVPLQFLRSRGTLPDIRDRHVPLPFRRRVSKARVMERAARCSRGRVFLGASPVAVEFFAFERGASRLSSGARCLLFAVLAKGAPWHLLLRA